MASTSGQDAITGARFTVPSQRAETLDKIYKTTTLETLDIGQQRRGIEKWETSKVNATISPVCGLKTLPGGASRLRHQKPRQSQVVSLMWGDRDRGPGELRWPHRICRKEYQIEECCPEGELQTSLESPFKNSDAYWFVHAWEKTTQGQKGNYWEHLRKQPLVLPGGLPAITSQSGRPYHSGGHRAGDSEVLLQ